MRRARRGLGGGAYGRLRARAGLTLLEIAIVVAILGIVAAMAGTSLTRTLPSWRTRRAANQMVAQINMCRQLAIAQDTRCRVRLASFDPDLDDGGDNVGAYFLELETATGTWDILPWDESGTDENVGEGTVVISDGGEDELHGVSVREWTALTGVDGDDIVFDQRGWLVNPTSDFDTTGYINVSFVNKPARAYNDSDEWQVRVSRGGLVRLESTRNTTVGNGFGTTEASTASSGGGGYAP